MSTATVQVAEVGGYAGRARCFAVSPPYEGHDFVTIWVQPAYGSHQRPELAVVPATDTGAAVEASLMRRPGSFVLHDDGSADDYFAGVCWLALLMLGQPGYELQDGS